MYILALVKLVVGCWQGFKFERFLTLTAPGRHRRQFELEAVVGGGGGEGGQAGVDVDTQRRR